MAKWQPIETAPKEIGKHVLLFGDGPNFHACIFVGVWWDENGRIFWRMIGGDQPAAPSHWMPLPARPDATA